MAYERQKFKNGQVLKAEHLACIEDCLCDMSPVADSFKFSSDCIGKAIRVLAVDDAWRPTKWETVDLPDNSGKVDKTSVVQETGSGEDKIMSQKAVTDALEKKQPSGDYALRSELPSVPVKSVNGKTGAVVLDAAAVGARPSTWTPTASDVGALPSSTKIPAKTSDLTNDSGFIKGYTETDPTVPAWAKASTKPSYSKSEVGLGNVDNVRQYSADNPPPYPVTSVNGKTGAVSLSASDVGARPSSWTPTAANVGAVPTSRKVNGKALSADITLSAADVGAVPTTSIVQETGDSTTTVMSQAAVTRELETLSNEKVNQADLEELVFALFTNAGEVAL